MTILEFPIQPGMGTSRDVTCQYVAWMTAQGLAPVTIAKRSTFAQRMARDWQDLHHPPSPAALASWLGQYGGWTRRAYLGHLRSLIRFLLEAGHIDTNPLATYRTPPTPRPRPRPLSAAELCVVLTAADDRLRAWLLLGVYAGLRAHEIAKIHGRDIDERVLFVSGKGGKEALLPTHPVLWTLAQTYPRDGHWFSSPHRDREHVHYSLVSNTIRAHFRAHGIDHGATHRLRATYGTNLRRAGVDMKIIQELMRHSSLVTTEHYLGVGEDERTVAIRRLAA